MGELVQLQQDAKRLVNTLAVPQMQYGLGIHGALGDFSFETFLQVLKKVVTNYTVPKGVLVYTLEQVPKALFERYFSTLYGCSVEQDKLKAMHYAGLEEVLFFVVPDDLVCKELIAFNTVVERAGASHVVLIIGKRSKVRLIDSMECKGYGSSVVREVFVDESAEVLYQSLNEVNEGYDFSTLICSLKKNSAMKVGDVLVSGKISNHSVSIRHEETGSRSEYGSALVSTQGGEYTVRTETIHTTEHTTGLMKIRGVVAEESKILSRSIIRVEKEASFTKSVEKSDLVLVGEKSHGEAVPILEVENQDVACTHSSTISRLKQEQLFYMQSRGLDETQAREELLCAFVGEVVDDFPESLGQRVRLTMQKMLGWSII